MNKYQYPIKDFINNVTYTKNNGAVAWYKVNGRTVGLNSQGNKDEFKKSLKELATKLQKFGEVDYKVIPVSQETSKIIDAASSQYKGPHKDTGLYYADRAKTVLNEEIGNTLKYKFFIGVRLKENNDEDGKFFSDIKNAVKGISTTIKKLSGVETGIDEETIAKYESSEEDAFSIITSHLDADRCTEQEMKYVVRYQFVRGHGRVQAAGKDYNLTEAMLDPSEPGYLKIQQLDSESVVAFLPISEFPIDMSNTSWVYGTQSFPFPVETDIKTIYMGKEKDYKETNTLKKRFREQDAELVNANEDEDTLVSQGREVLFELENSIRNDREPLVRTYACFVVWGSTKEECAERAKKIKDHYEEWTVVQPLHDQHLLFHQFIPGATIKTTDWMQPMNTNSFAESLFSLTRKIGNNVGFFLGKDISLDKENSRELVFYNPFAASQGVTGSKYSSPHVTISGPTGMGKSNLLKYIVFNAIPYGARILLTDPKNEFQKLIEIADWVDQQDIKKEAKINYRNLVESFNLITLSAEKKDAGKLDPLTFLTGEEAHDAAISVLEYLLELDNTERGIKTAISQAVRTVIYNKEPGLLKVVNLLRDNEDPKINEAGDFLFELGTNGIAKLLFSDGTVHGIDLYEQINVLGIQNLTLPKTGEKPATRDEHIATALMIPLAKFSAKFSRNEIGMALTIFEEAWMLANTPQGDRMIKELLRTGRSLDSAVYLVTQSIVDYNKQDIKDGIGTKMAFKAKTPEEASAIIDYLGLEDNKANRDMLEDLTEGEFVMEDIYGRTAIVKADVLFGEWQQAFNTKPKNKETMVQLEEAFVL